MNTKIEIDTTRMQLTTASKIAESLAEELTKARAAQSQAEDAYASDGSDARWRAFTAARDDHDRARIRHTHAVAMAETLTRQLAELEHRAKVEQLEVYRDAARLDVNPFVDRIAAATTNLAREYAALVVEIEKQREAAIRGEKLAAQLGEPWGGAGALSLGWTLMAPGSAVAAKLSAAASAIPGLPMLVQVDRRHPVIA